MASVFGRARSGVSAADDIDRRSALNRSYGHATKPTAGFFQIGICFCEAETEQILAAFAEERLSGHCGYPAAGEQVHSFFLAVAARQSGSIRKDIVGALRPRG